ncbi:hypothetical protein FRB99_001790, partial [Tulasnella sp. 403]
MSTSKPDPTSPSRSKEANTGAGPSLGGRPLGSIRPQGLGEPTGPRVIGNMAAPTGANTTRTGAPRMTFLPNHPVRRKVQTAESTPAAAQPSHTPAFDPQRGRGRGRGAFAGRGRGDVNMVASGPFALGPAAAGSSTTFRRPTNSFSSVGLRNAGGAAQGGSGLSNTAAPVLKKGGDVTKDDEDDEGKMSDDEGEEKVDMEFVNRLDWNAPVAIRRRKEDKKGRSRKLGGRGKEVKAEEGGTENAGDETKVKDDAHALDLSESEQEEEMEDIVEHFTSRNLQQDQDQPEDEELYLFQFPSPFPSFQLESGTATGPVSNTNAASDEKGKGKSVSWAPDLKKSEGDEKVPVEQDDVKLRDGLVGQLEIYKSGAVKIRFGDHVVMDVFASTQPSFLQQVAYVDMDKRQLVGLGRISKRFCVSPDVDLLLDELKTGRASDDVKSDPTLEEWSEVYHDVEISDLCVTDFDYGGFHVTVGCVGCGSDFLQDVLLDPKTRDVNDVQHKVTAVASRSVEKAREFIKDFIADEGGVGATKAYGSYEELVKDPNVDAVYIGQIALVFIERTPHSHHYDCAVLSLNAGKHVLLEKPATVNAAEFRSLTRLAKARDVFLMEAMWTRFLPVTRAIKDILEGGKLGELKVLHADLSGDFDIDNIPTTHRILDPQLGGGALLDLGPYPLVWTILALYEDPRNQKSPPTRISSGMVKTTQTGVDSSTSFTLDFQRLGAQAILSCSITIPSPPAALVMRFRRGNIIVPRPIYRPDSFTVQKFAKPGSNEIASEETYEFASRLVGGGWHYQADEVARCVRDGKIQSDVWSWDKTELQMAILDE